MSTRQPRVSDRRVAFAWRGLSVLVLGALWWLATNGLEWIEPYRFPGPLDVQEAFDQMIQDGYAGGSLWQHVGTTCWLVLRGFLLAVSLGTAFGLLMSLSPFWRDFLYPLFTFIRPIPPLAWIPLALLWFGLGDTSKLFVMGFAAFIPVVINTMTGVRQLDPVLLAAARVHGARGRIWLTDMVLPGALPHLLTGVRLALQTCWSVIVAAELLGAFYGIGKVLSTAKDDVYPGMVLLGMFIVALLGIASSLLLHLVERRTVPWSH